MNIIEELNVTIAVQAEFIGSLRQYIRKIEDENSQLRAEMERKRQERDVADTNDDISAMSSK